MSGFRPADRRDGRPGPVPGDDVDRSLALRLSTTARAAGIKTLADLPLGVPRRRPDGVNQHGRSWKRLVVPETVDGLVGTLPCPRQTRTPVVGSGFEIADHGRHPGSSLSHRSR
jgi:hypothetical protein